MLWVCVCVCVCVCIACQYDTPTFGTILGPNQFNYLVLEHEGMTEYVMRNNRIIALK